MKTKPSVIFAALLGTGLVLGATLDAFGVFHPPGALNACDTL